MQVWLIKWRRGQAERREDGNCRVTGDHDTLLNSENRKIDKILANNIVSPSWKGQFEKLMGPHVGPKL